jgi:starch phosphorylase
MKFLMNGCLLLATADGSTVEIIEELGSDNLVSDNLLCLFNLV